MFIILLKHKADLDIVARERSSHMEFLEKYYQNGKFIVSGGKFDKSGGVILVNSSDENEVKSIVEADPFFQKGISDFEIIGFNPTKFCSELSGVVK